MADEYYSIGKPGFIVLGYVVFKIYFASMTSTLILAKEYGYESHGADVLLAIVGDANLLSIVVLGVAGEMAYDVYQDYKDEHETEAGK